MKKFFTAILAMAFLAIGLGTLQAQMPKYRIGSATLLSNTWAQVNGTTQTATNAKPSVAVKLGSPLAFMVEAVTTNNNTATVALNLDVSADNSTWSTTAPCVLNFMLNAATKVVYWTNVPLTALDTAYIKITSATTASTNMCTVTNVTVFWRE